MKLHKRGRPPHLISGVVKCYNVVPPSRQHIITYNNAGCSISTANGLELQAFLRGLQCHFADVLTGNGKIYIATSVPRFIALHAYIKKIDFSSSIAPHWRKILMLLRHKLCRSIKRKAYRVLDACIRSDVSL